MDIDVLAVGLATYKRPDELRLALQALQRQKYARLRVLVGDDAPSAETREVVREFGGTLHVQHIEHPHRRGVLGNHLDLLSRHDAEFFMFHGDDDQLLDGALDLLSEKLKAGTEFDAVFASYRQGNAQAALQVDLARHRLVRLWAHRSRWVRITAFYLFPAFAGKCNLFYGLFRTEALRAMALDKAVPPRDHHLNMDEMIAYQAVRNGRVLVLARPCHLFASGNAKHYRNGDEGKGSVAAAIEFVGYEFRSLGDYWRNCGTAAERALVATLFPVKLLIALTMRYARWPR